MADLEHPLVLEGQRVRLEPLDETHIAPLAAIARAAPERYRYTSTPTTGAEVDAYFSRAFRERDKGLAYPFALIAAGEVVGTSRYASLDYAKRNCELGYTWLSPSAQGTGINTESKYLMLKYAFEQLELLRVYFYTDVRNTRSERAIRKLGAHYEGTLRAERVLSDGHIRDTLLFSVVYYEWHKVKAGLEAALADAV